MDHSQGGMDMGRDVEGTSGNDTLRGSDHHSQRLMGRGGDDALFVGHAGGGAYGGGGNDTIHGSGNGTAQSHIYAGDGDDTIYLNPTNRSAPHGEHVWGGQGADRFIFNNVNEGDQRIVGRIEDYDPSRGDEIWVDDLKVDFDNLPDNIRVVEYRDQPWILINERILYTLEGARVLPEDGRDSGDEVHFIDWPPEWENGVPASADIPYRGLENFFPADEVVEPEGGFGNIRNGNGTDGHDSYYGSNAADLVQGRGGNDLLMGNEGHDEIHGGAGDDSISGGIDMDLIHGDSGDDVAYGGAGNDTLHGDAGDDILHGNRGDDIVLGGDGDDVLNGEDGNDVLVGGAGGDRIWGGNGKDILMAGDPGGDTSPGERGDMPVNRMGGGAGNDTLFGADDERSIMTGGIGNNTFVAAASGEIIITDWKDGDTLNLAGRMALDQRVVDIARVENVDGDRSDLVFDLYEGGSVRLSGMGGADLDEMMGNIVTQGPAPDPDQYLEFTDGIVEGHPDFELHSPFMVGGDEVNVYDPEIHGGGEDDAPEDTGGTGDGGNDPRESDESDDNSDDDDGKWFDGTCFVATASFGEARHPDVTWLRNWRDETLVQHPVGRAFIRFYWKIGPVMARAVRHDGFTGRISRYMISRLVTYIKG